MFALSVTNTGLRRSMAGDGDEDDLVPIWKGMSSFEAGKSEAPPAGVVIVDPFCDYLGKRCIQVLEEAGYAVVQASTGVVRITRSYRWLGVFVSCLLHFLRFMSKSLRRRDCKWFVRSSNVFLSVRVNCKFSTAQSLTTCASAHV